MKAWLRGFYYSFPIQLLFLHFRKYQVLLLFWFILFAVVNGSFMNTFGADSLFLAPEYLDNVNSISAALSRGVHWYVYHELEYQHVYFVQQAF